MLQCTKLFVCCKKVSNITKIQPLCHTESDVEAHDCCENKESSTTSSQNNQCPVKFKNLEIKW